MIKFFSAAGLLDSGTAFLIFLVILALVFLFKVVKSKSFTFNINYKCNTKT